MSPQADYVVSNGTGAAVRSDINGQLAAIVSNNSGASAPATTYAYMLWADTSTNLLKLRNGANSAWITVGDLTAANLGLATLASPTFTGTATIPTLTVSTAANIPLGSAASPTLYFTGDSNTGLYSPGADQVALSTGGTGRLFIDSSGRCGIGTSSPSSALDVSGAISLGAVALPSAGTARIFSRNTDSNLYIQTGSGNTLNFLDGSQNTMASFGSSTVTLQTGNSPRLSIDSSGRVGIGTTSPGARVDVDGGDVHVRTNYRVLTDTVQGYTGLSTPLALNAAQTVAISTASTERARIDSSGRLLVGTSSWSANATVVAQGNSGGSTSRGILYLALGANNPADGTALGHLEFSDSGGGRAASVISARDGGTWTSGSSHPGRLVFSTTADGASSPTERLRIAQNGAWGLAGANYGSSGQVLTSNGSGSAPTWQTAGGGLTVGTAVASTSGTSIDFTGIPSTVKRIQVMLKGVSTNGSSNLLIQIGSGSVTTSGYDSASGSVAAQVASSTAGFLISQTLGASYVVNGSSIIALQASNTYVNTAVISAAVGNAFMSGGNVALSGTLDRIRITTVNGTDTFDAGSINIMYES